MIKLVKFPSLDNANEDGLLAMGADLSVDTLVSAYSQGIFPWFNDDQPILWWSPDPRLVLYPNDVKISKSLAKSIRNKYRVTCNTAFEQVIKGCALRGKKPTTLSPNSGNSEDTWITDSMHEAYTALHKNAYAHSIETWFDGELVGGLYGVCLGKVFFGESMFSRKPDASKVALAYLCKHLADLGFHLIDCQVASNHLLSLGAVEIPRAKFISALADIDINQPQTDFENGFPASALDIR